MSHSGRAPAIYLVRPGSSLSHQLGINSAPTADTADPFSNGCGADALAFRFNRAVILTTPPAYIVQATPNKFYTQPNAKAFFGQPQSIERRSDGFVAYYTIQVYSPSEDRSGRGRALVSRKKAATARVRYDASHDSRQRS